jgi:hypothetical protein
LKIVYLGDIVAKSGREAVKNAILHLKQTYKYDVLIANVDNAAHGFGCTPRVCNQLFDAGVNVLVTGDHVWNQKDIYPYLAKVNHTQIDNVKWSIARTINLMYLHHTTKSILKLEEYFCLEHLQKPTPKHIISVISNKLLYS